MGPREEVDLTDRLTAELYAEMRKIAAIRMRGERVGHTLQATALAHEAFLRLSQGPRDGWNDRTHFLATAARIMRNILVTHARKRKRRIELLALVEHESPSGLEGADAIAMDEAIDELAKQHDRCARAIELRFILGFTNEEAADALGVSVRTVKGDAQFGLAWLRRRLSGSEPA